MHLHTGAQVIFCVFPMHFQGTAEKLSKNLESQLSEVNCKLDDSSRHCSELQATQSRATQEANEVSRQLEDAESQISQLTKQKAMLAKQLEEVWVEGLGEWDKGG